ncbi:MAG TPA: ABC transporter ATP-binding protein [Bacillota bacterium]|nr:ABC transporter ATP-binding protein [Bacillota bacterium]
MIKTDNLSKTFTRKRGSVAALKNISLEITAGEFVSITGPSGSGKSTMLLALGGMSAPTAGKVLWHQDSVYDWDLAKRAEWRAKMVGFVFQTFNLVPYLTVYENVSLALSLSGARDIKEDSIEKLLERMKLSNRADHLPSELSIGQQQRVALARALVKNPKMILADEPTGNLDPQTASEILDILREINTEGKTVVIITHDPNVAKMAQRNIRIVEGEIQTAN